MGKNSKPPDLIFKNWWNRMLTGAKRGVPIKKGPQGYL